MGVQREPEELRGMQWVWRRGGLTWTELAKRVWTEIDDDDVFGRAAQLSYYLILALFPFLIVLSSITGLVFAGDVEAYHRLLARAQPMMPPAAFELIRVTADQITLGAGGGLLSFGLLATLWAASSGMEAVINGLNVAYDVREFRSWWKRRLIAIALTIALLVMTVSALVAALWGGRIARWAASHLDMNTAYTVASAVAQVALPVLFMAVVFLIIHRFGPNVKDYPLVALLPGTVFGVLCWLLATWAFRLYLSFTNSYNRTYGSLGAVMILLLWLYLTGAAILLGGEINAEIREAAARRGSKEARKPVEDTDG